MVKQHIPLKELEVYQLARELSSMGWEFYQKLSWQEQKVIGDQFIRSVDSVGANIAEGYGRFHFLDRIKFYYNARGSLNECCSHWLELLVERQLVNQEEFKELQQLSKQLEVKLNNFIAATYKSKQRNK